MRNIDKFCKKKCLNILDDLNSILHIICEIEKLLENEIISSDVGLVYEGYLQYNNIDFKNMTFKQIKTVIEYQKRGCFYDECIKLDYLIECLKSWFFSKLLEDSYFSKIPISYDVSAKLDDLRFTIETFNEQYYLIEINFETLGKESLENLKRRVESDIQTFRRRVYQIDNKYEAIRADSDYVKRNKK